MSKDDSNRKMICKNRKARHDYAIEKTYEVGLVLKGTEVKSLRAGKADLTDAFAKIYNGELFLIGLHIAAYDKASHFNHEPRRERKLLEKKRVIEKLVSKLNERGFTLVPLEMYFKDGYAKVLLGLAKGKKQYDRRDQIKAKEDRRQLKKEQYH